MTRFSLLLLGIIALPTTAQANWWDDVGPIRDPQKAKLASRMGIYTQGGWDQVMRGSTGGIPNAFLANAALHPEAQVMIGGMGRQLGDSKQAPSFSWKQLTYGAAEDLLVGNRNQPTTKPQPIDHGTPEGRSAGRVELTYRKRNGTEKVATVKLTAARQLVVGSRSGNPILTENRVQFLRQTAGGLRTVRTRPLVGIRVFAASK